MEVGWTCWKNEGQQMDKNVQGGHRKEKENEADQGGDGQMTFPNTKVTVLP